MGNTGDVVVAAVVVVVLAVVVVVVVVLAVVVIFSVVEAEVARAFPHRVPELANHKQCCLLQHT